MTLKRTKLIWWLSLIGFLFILGCLLYWPHQLSTVDNSLRILVNSHRTPGFTSCLLTITHFFDLHWILLWLVITTLAGWLLVDRSMGLEAFCTIMLVCVINRIIKGIVERPRPSTDVLLHYAGYSFPSGHSSAVAAVCGMLIIICWRTCRRRWLQWLWTIIWTLVILLIGYSRVYVGAHYPSDVCAGWFLGLWLVATCHWFWYHWRN